jgi:hypothetical protein
VAGYGACASLSTLNSAIPSVATVARFSSALGVRLVVCPARHVAADWADLLEFTVRRADAQLALEHKRDVVGLVPVQRNLRVRVKLEEDDRRSLGTTINRVVGETLLRLA